jgi:hypothetical protein
LHRLLPLFDRLLFRTLSLYRRAEQKEKGSARLFRLAATESSEIVREGIGRAFKESAALVVRRLRRERFLTAMTRPREPVGRDFQTHAKEKRKADD